MLRRSTQVSPGLAATAPETATLHPGDTELSYVCKTSAPGAASNSQALTVIASRL